MIKTVYCENSDILVVFNEEYIDVINKIFTKTKEQAISVSKCAETNTKTNKCKFCGNGEIINLSNNNLIVGETINHNMGCLIPEIKSEYRTTLLDIQHNKPVSNNKIKGLIKGLNESIQNIDLSDIDSIKLVQLTLLISPLAQHSET